MKIEVNGEPRDVPQGTTVAGLIGRMQFRTEQVAVEVNEELVPRVRHDQHLLQPGDRLEVVTLVGGG